MKGELWVDGSFVTQKIDPGDVDILVHVSSGIYEGNAGKRQAVDWATSPNLKKTHSCDAFPWIEYTRRHPGFKESERDRIYWTDVFGGHKEGFIPKGIIVISLPARTA